MLKQKYFLTGIFILSAERQPIKLAWRKIVWLPQKIAYRERFEDAKGYALYACIAHMNKFVDSTSFINKDYSGEYFVQLSSLSLEEIIRIKEYVDKECMNYWSISQNPEGNMIAYSSWKFYNSKDLDNFIHKTLRKNIGNYER